VHGYVQTRSREVEELAAALYEKFGEWNATSMYIHQSAFAFVGRRAGSSELDPKKVGEAMRT